MQKLLVMLILVLTGFLSSCRGIPPKSNLTIERCFLVLQDEMSMEDGGWSYTGYCRCHNWSITKDSIGRSSESVNKPLLYCDKKGGMSAEDWGKTSLFLEDWRLYLRKQ